MEPAHGPPLQARVAAANGTVLQLAKMMKLKFDPGAQGMTRGTQKQMNGGKLLRAVGMAKVKWQAKGGQAHSLLNKALQTTQPADSPSGSGLK